jgi:hypothetical protein
MKKAKIIAVLALATLAGSASRSHAVTVFNDTFGTSTLNAQTPGAPTATSASYSVLSSKNSLASSIAPGSLQLQSVQTSAGISEIQARFRTTPLTLVNVDDYVELSMTFIPTKVHNILNGGNFAVGLYKSGGVDPVPGDAMGVGQMANGQLNATDATFVTGFAQNWEGYHSRNVGTGGNWQMFYRPPQTDTVNENQDLLQANVGGGAYDLPAPIQVTPQAPPTMSLATGTIYTYTFRATLLADGVVDLTDKIYEGAVVTETPLFSHTVQTNPATTPTVTQFDALAIGMRPSHVTGVDPNPSDPAGPHIMNFSRIAIDTNLAVPVENANFDGIGQVDGNDFLKWQQGLGLTGQTTNANGDANGSGAVDAADLAIWRSHFGQATTEAAAAAVPEPTSAALVACLVALGYRRRR